VKWPAIRAPVDDPLHGDPQLPFLLGSLLAWGGGWAAGQ
jgi:hypothetical protein